MRSLGQNVTDLDLNDMISEVDADGSGTLDFAEFLTMMVRKIRGVDVLEEINSAFASFDTTRCGKIPAVELRTIIKGMEEGLEEEEIEKMMKEALVDAEGNVNYTEFCNLLVGGKA